MLRAAAGPARAVEAARAVAAWRRARRERGAGDEGEGAAEQRGGAWERRKDVEGERARGTGVEKAGTAGAASVGNDIERGRLGGREREDWAGRRVTSPSGRKVLHSQL